MAVEPLLGTRAQKAFILTITLQAIIVLAMVGVTFRMVDVEVQMRSARYKTLPCYLAIFALAEIFEGLMAYDALRQRNVIQLGGILVFHLAMLVFAALQIHQTRTALVTLGDCPGSVDFVNCGGEGTLWTRVQPFLIVAPCVIAASWFAMLFWIKQLYAEFGWAIFHVVGANPRMKTMYQWYQIIICLLKFDFFFFVGVTMQMLIIVLQTDSAEFGITIAAIPVVILLLFLCSIAVQREIKWLMTMSLIMMLAAQSYFLYKLVRMYQPESEDAYITTRATLTVFTVVAFILLVATFAVGLRCFSDFDQGLITSKLRDIPGRRPYNEMQKIPQGDILTGNNTMGTPLQPRVSIE
ncbi:hypothetical protein AX16_003657 [Volvariella volvacea WC 439]|nr:hypothetical protein AX16_003657 [Volvariella volvacea WC 439]